MSTMIEFNEVVTQMATARARLDAAEQRYFDGVAHLDELRAAYEGLQQAERRLTIWEANTTRVSRRRGGANA
jgi:exonuclease VII small subunit